MLTPRDLLLFASMGYGKFEVYKKIKISILSVGNELLKPGQKIQRNKIYASNAYGISGLLKKFSCKCKILPISDDTIHSISKNLIYALKNSDLIITIGGASVGNYDLVKDAVKKMRGKFIFEKVNVRPGKPTFAGILNKIPIIGLPGNPVSSYVCAQLFVIPLIEEIFNLNPKNFSLLSVYLGSGIPANGSRMHLMRGNVSVINQKKVVSLKKVQDSSLTKTLQESNCLVIRPPYDLAKAKGDKIDIIKLI
jgi:molybdopterin molybdotransferase